MLRDFDPSHAKTSGNTVDTHDRDPNDTYDRDPRPFRTTCVSSVDTHVRNPREYTYDLNPKEQNRSDGLGTCVSPEGLGTCVSTPPGVPADLRRRARSL